MWRRNLWYWFAVWIMNSVKKMARHHSFDKNLKKWWFHFLSWWWDWNLYASDRWFKWILDGWNKTYYFEYDYINRKWIYSEYDVNIDKEIKKEFKASPDKFKERFLNFLKK